MRLYLVNPLGHRADGRPIWSFSGSQPDDGGDGSGGTGGDDGGGDGGGGTGDGGGDDDDDTVGTDGLTAKGRKALTTERGKVRALTGEVRTWRTLAKEFGEGGQSLTAEQMRERLSGGTRGGSGGSGGGDPVDADAIRKQAEREANDRAARRIALSEIRALAAGSFADPADAVAFLQGDVDELLGRDGEPDEGLIKDALADLLQRKPHLGKQDDSDTDYDGGARNKGGGGDQSMSAFIRGERDRRLGRRPR